MRSLVSWRALSASFSAPSRRNSLSTRCRWWWSVSTRLGHDGQSSASDWGLTMPPRRRRSTSSRSSLFRSNDVSSCIHYYLRQWNEVNTAGDYEIGSVRVCVCVCRSVCELRLHNRQERWHHPVKTSTLAAICTFGSAFYSNRAATDWKFLLD